MGIRTGNIALAGRPNAGKSTFLNNILGEKVSIVSDKPQTTRNRILGVYHTDAMQVGFLDLPGIHKPQHRMNRIMMKSVSQGLADADLIFHFVDATEAIGPGDKFVNKFLAEKKLPTILVVNKVDLVNKSKLIPRLEAFQETFNPQEMVPISAKTSDNIDRLMTIASSLLEEGEPLYGEDMLTDQSMRFMAQEFIREKILHYTHEEIPHATAVTIEQYLEEEDGVLIRAIIWADRPNQRKILLGKQGQMIRKIRHGAKRALKQFLKQSVELELFVKVKEHWRNQDGILKSLDLR